MNFKERQEQDIAQIEAALNRFLPEKNGFQKTVLEAMEYSVMAGGKRLRPMLLLESYRMFAGKAAEDAEREKAVEPFLAAMEMLHTYSLVHDDLPAMDDDDTRRGRRTTHVVYGEAMGILAGDALLNFAFETAMKAADFDSDAARVLHACRIFADKAGIYGMIGGQVVDVEAEKKERQLTDEELHFVYECKTSALIEASLMIGAVMAGASQEQVAACEKIGSLIGIAFQIQDDILDLTSTTEVLGKPVGSDEKNHKQTYVSIHGMEQSGQDVRILSEEAISLLRGLDAESEFVEWLIDQLITREK